MFAESALAIIVAFGAGVIAQSLVMIGGRIEKDEWIKVLVAVVVGILGLLPGKRESAAEYAGNVGLHFLFVFALYAGTFATLFDKKIHSAINQRLLLVSNLVLVYVMLRADVDLVWFFIIALPSLFVLSNAFFNVDKSFVAKVLLYCWFIVMSVATAIVYFSFQNVQVFLENFSHTGSLGIFELFSAGAAFFFIIAHMWFLLRLIPVTKKHQSVQSRLAEVREHLNLMVSEYRWEKDNHTHNILTVLLACALLAINFHYSVVSDWLVIAIAFGGMTLLEQTYVIFSTQSRVEITSSPTT